jgi:hypothetical protein
MRKARHRRAFRISVSVQAGIEMPTPPLVSAP